MSRITEPKVSIARARALTRRTLWRIGDRLSAPTPENLPVVLPSPPRGGLFRISFLVCESAKWGHQNLFDTLTATPGFSVSFAVTLSDVALRMSPVARARHHAEQLAQFARCGPIGASLYCPEDRLRDPSCLDVELIFVQQPWGMQDLPRRLSKKIACAHISYELGVIDAPAQQYALPDFHPWLWRLFLASPLQLRSLQRTRNAPALERVVVSGSPRLDEWRAAIRTRAKHVHSITPRQVVWAPHHSVANTSLRLGTFEWSGPSMLLLAQDNPQIQFVLRPHPNLWHMLDRQQSGASARFKKAWSSLHNTFLHETGDALSVLLEADALITDSASFLAEFLTTGRPILRLTRPDSACLSDFGVALAPAYYHCAGPEEFRQTFKSVISLGEDPLMDIRRAVARHLAPPHCQDAASRIRDEIIRALLNEPAHSNRSA